MKERRKHYLFSRRRKMPSVLAEFSTDEITQNTLLDRHYQIGDKTYVVDMRSLRYSLFKTNLTCAACGIKGDVVLLEQHIQQQQRNGKGRKAHLELYSKQENGLLVLMTKDHIVPRSKGGSNAISNLQTMCVDCNSFKGDGFSSLTKIAKRVIECEHCGGKMETNKCLNCFNGKRIQDIINCANKLHKGHYRKNGIPYIVHPIKVMDKLVKWGINDCDILCAALLHDTLEDGYKNKNLSDSARKNLVKQNIISVSNMPVFKYVQELTHDSDKETKSQYMKTWGNKSVGALLIKLSDRIDNVKDFLDTAPDYAKKYFAKASALFDAFYARKNEIDKQVFQLIDRDLQSLKKEIDTE